VLEPARDRLQLTGPAPSPPIHDLRNSVSARHVRFPECLARIVRADILSESKAGDQRMAVEERNLAEVSMRETGALIFANFIKDRSATTNAPMPRQMPPIAGRTRTIKVSARPHRGTRTINKPVTKLGLADRSIQFERSLQLANKSFLTWWAPERRTPMSEVEFDRLLDAVRIAVAPVPHLRLSTDMLDFDAPPVAANDNQLAWPFIPFPAGWCGSC
jgi:hypothetical protein